MPAPGARGWRYLHIFLKDTTAPVSDQGYNSGNPGGDWGFILDLRRRLGLVLLRHLFQNLWQFQIGGLNVLSAMWNTE